MIGMFDKQKASLEIFLCIPIQTGVLRQFKISRDWWMDKCKINHTMTTDFFQVLGKKRIYIENPIRSITSAELHDIGFQSFTLFHCKHTHTNSAVKDSLMNVEI